ncbi:DnaJ family domain-containing protein [Ideonella sp. DXS29W]|uniref:DnaJ family domain-containing protein n=1 Tax=Ideonella lacteola TaxID=2984193 RepID=A0ABU9BVL5_9BURK
MIADHLAQSYRSGELQSAESFGKPMKESEGYLETPDEFRMPFKVLKNAGVTPPEVQLFHQRAELRAQLESATTDDARRALQQRLSELEQMLALRLEGMRASGRL